LPALFRPLIPLSVVARGLMPAIAQCTKGAPGASAYRMMRTSSLAFLGTPDHLIGIGVPAPSHVYRLGMAPFSLNAGLVRLKPLASETEEAVAVVEVVEGPQHAVRSVVECEEEPHAVRVTAAASPSAKRFTPPDGFVSAWRRARATASCSPRQRP